MANPGSAFKASRENMLLQLRRCELDLQLHYCADYSDSNQICWLARVHHLHCAQRNVSANNLLIISGDRAGPQGC